MITIADLDDIALLKETVELECKLAQGRNGVGQIPDDFWPTFSAFSNTRGGVILLGIRETREGFSLAGLQDIEKIRTDLFNTLNNKQKVSSNTLLDEDVRIVHVQGKRLLIIDVPAATSRSYSSEFVSLGFAVLN